MPQINEINGNPMQDTINSFDEQEDGLTEVFSHGWSNPPKLTDLKQDYQAALTDHTTHTAEVDNWLNLMDGTSNAKRKKGRSSIQPRLIRKQAEWRYASLSEPFLSTDDMFEAEPVTFEDKQAAEQNNLVLNNQINTKIDKVAFIDEYIRTAVDEGTVVVKTGWIHEEEEREVEQPIFTMVPVTDPAQANQMMAQGMQPMQEVQTGSEMVTQKVTVRNHPTLEVCEYSNLVIDPTCLGDLDNANFVIHSYETSLKDLQADGRYSNLDNLEDNAGSVLGQPDHVSSDTGSFEFKDKARKKLILNEYWGYWDVNDVGTVEPILACYIGNTLVRLEANPFPDKKLPFVKVQYLPRRKHIYGQPDATLLEDNQKIIGAVTRGLVDLMGRSANSQMGVRKDALDVANARKFEEGEDYKFNVGVNPDQAFHMHTYPDVPNAALSMLQLQNNEAESITGVKAFSSGITGNGLGSTATGVRGALDAASKRELGILRRLASGVVQIGRKFISMNSEFLSEEEVVRVSNTEFVPVQRDDLDGSIDLRLTISTAESDNEKAQELSFMLQTMGNNMDPQITMMVLADIAKLRKMPNLAKRLEEYQPQPDPLQQERGQLELELLKAQIANETAKAQENTVDIGLKQAKTQTEQAKARQMQSGADKTDLDFLEQQDGTVHDREIAKQTNQSRNNIDGKAAEAMLQQNATPPG